MPSKEDIPQLTEIEREKLLFLLGTYAYSIPTFEWEELAKHLEKFTTDVASRYHADKMGADAEKAPDESQNNVVDNTSTVPNPGMTARRRKKRPMPEWEA